MHSPNGSQSPKKLVFNGSTVQKKFPITFYFLIINSYKRMRNLYIFETVPTFASTDHDVILPLHSRKYSCWKNYAMGEKWIRRAVAA